jgi:hypothetical protein
MIKGRFCRKGKKKHAKVLNRGSWLVITIHDSRSTIHDPRYVGYFPPAASMADGQSHFDWLTPEFSG